MYTPKYVTEKDVRNFFTPPLDYNDLGTAELLLKIESVEDMVEAVYFSDSVTTSAKARIPCLLLIASKIILNPTLAKKYFTLNKETLGDYSYELGLGTRGVVQSPYAISKTWEDFALDMLKNRSTLVRFGLWKAND